VLLRASGEAAGTRYDASAAVRPERESGVPHGAVLLAFAEAALGADAAALDLARERVREELGPAALVDAAAVIGAFEQVDRIADATGIPLDAPLQLLTGDVREELGLERFASARNTPAAGALARSLGRALTPLRVTLLRLAARRAGRKRG
jgi:hypothetical protein